MKRAHRLQLLCLVGLAAGCGDEAPPPAPTPPPRPAAAKPAPAPVAAATQGPVYAYAYNPIGKRDPFRSPLVAVQRPAEQVAACNEPLCQIDTDALRVVAVVSGDANPMAMVEDGVGIGHVVRRNTKIGKQGGKVTAIQRDCVVVTSFVQGVDGKAQPNRVSMCVKQDDRMQDPLDLLQSK